MAKTFIVTAALKFPSAYDRGAEFEIRTNSKADAIKQARAEVRRERLYDRHDGALIYSVREAE